MREAYGCKEKDCTFNENLCWPERYIFKTARQRLASTVGGNLDETIYRN